MRAIGGFGLLELMVTLLLVAILSTLAVPSLTHFVEQARLASAVNDYVAAMYGARSHAVRTSQVAILCPSVNGRECDDSPSFAKGWLITTDPHTPEAAVRYWPAPKADVSTNYPDDGYVRYAPDGLPVRNNGAFLAGTAEFCVDEQGQNIILSRNGRLRTISTQC